MAGEERCLCVCVGGGGGGADGRGVCVSAGVRGAVRSRWQERARGGPAAGEAWQPCLAVQVLDRELQEGRDLSALQALLQLAAPCC
jgi:hypothetical protein